MATGDDTGRQMMPLSPVIKKEDLGSPFSPGHSGSPVDRAFSSPAMSPTMSSTTTTAATTPLHAPALDAHSMDFTTTDTNSMTFHSGTGGPATATNSPKTEFPLCGFTSTLDGGGGSGNSNGMGSTPSTPTTPCTPVSVIGSHHSQQQHHQQPHPPHPHHHPHQRRKSGYDSSTSPDSPDRHFCSSTTQSNGDLNLSSRAEVKIVVRLLK